MASSLIVPNFPTYSLSNGQSLPAQQPSPAMPRATPTGMNYNLSLPTSAPKTTTTTAPKTSVAPKVGRIDPVAAKTTVSNAPSGPTQEEKDAQALARQIDELYGGNASALQNQYNNVLGTKDDFINSVVSPFDAQQPLLDSAYQSGLDQNSQQAGVQAQQQHSAMDEAKHLYSELQQANQQRFGGSTSTGQFVSDLQGRQLQQNIGNIQTTYGQNTAALQQQAKQISDQYNAQTQSLAQQKSAAKSQAEVAFAQQLSAITAAQDQNAQAKSAAKLDLLKQYNSYNQQLESQFNTLQQNMYSAAQAAQQQLQQSVATYQAQAGRQINLSGLPNAQYAQPTAPGAPQTVDLNSILAAPAKKKPVAAA